MTRQHINTQKLEIIRPKKRMITHKLSIAPRKKYPWGVVNILQPNCMLCYLITGLAIKSAGVSNLTVKWRYKTRCENRLIIIYVEDIGGSSIERAGGGCWSSEATWAPAAVVSRIWRPFVDAKKTWRDCTIYWYNKITCCIFLTAQGQWKKMKAHIVVNVLTDLLDIV